MKDVMMQYAQSRNRSSNFGNASKIQKQSHQTNYRSSSESDMYLVFDSVVQVYSRAEQLFSLSFAN